ncbi:unnamed protein product [Enterobius vermicularis]|uniref:Aa_trans domain-containing protein n=1 Tax=Enterobius vermicularis TaxID=51028 RepID=A0A0N4V8M0_ENTVE|nr:unnamed protein product [Enterobius vermicularis]
MFNKVNCTSGTNVWIPLLNMVVSFVGLFSVRALNLHWPAFIHFLGLCIISVLLMVTIAYFGIESAQWFQCSTFSVSQWAKNFSWIDLSLCVIAGVNGMLLRIINTLSIICLFFLFTI